MRLLQRFGVEQARVLRGFIERTCIGNIHKSVKSGSVSKSTCPCSLSRLKKDLLFYVVLFFFFFFFFINNPKTYDLGINDRLD